MRKLFGQINGRFYKVELYRHDGAFHADIYKEGVKNDKLTYSYFHGILFQESLKTLKSKVENSIFYDAELSGPSNLIKWSV